MCFRRFILFVEDLKLLAGMGVITVTCKMLLEQFFCQQQVEMNLFFEKAVHFLTI
jgi:hypothetical protein